MRKEKRRGKAAAANEAPPKGYDTTAEVLQRYSDFITALFLIMKHLAFLWIPRNHHTPIPGSVNTKRENSCYTGILAGDIAQMAKLHGKLEVFNSPHQ